jgi:hypothetical protein
MEEKSTCTKFYILGGDKPSVQGPDAMIKGKRTLDDLVVKGDDVVSKPNKKKLRVLGGVVIHDSKSVAAIDQPRRSQ